jgi:HSP20 family protein
VEPKRKDDPAGLRRTQNDVDKMFLDLLRGQRVPRYGKAAFRPNADVYFDKSEKAVVVRLELPGIDPAAIDLEVDENILRVSGTRSDEHHPEAVYQQMEIVYGRFERAVMLPPGVDAGKASARYSAGFLKIVLPMRARSASKRIAINAQDECEGGQER